MTTCGSKSMRMGKMLIEISQLKNTNQFPSHATTHSIVLAVHYCKFVEMETGYVLSLQEVWSVLSFGKLGIVLVSGWKGGGTLGFDSTLTR